VVQFIYIDETGSVGKGAKSQTQLILVGVIVREELVQALGERLNAITMSHLGWIPADFEFKGFDIWNGSGYWSKVSPTVRLAAYEAAMGLLVDLDLVVAYATIDKAKLSSKYGGTKDDSAYLLALQFLLQKINAYLRPGLGVVVADELKEQRLRAIRLVGDLQSWGVGLVPGPKLTSIIDSLHYVSSKDSPGVQMADLVAFAIQRDRGKKDTHADAISGLQRIRSNISDQTRTWREPWPR